MPSYDLDKIEEVGTTHAPALADWYFETLELVDKAGRWSDNAFSDSLVPLWNDCYVFTYEVVYESAINLEAFGPSLVQVVELIRESESQNTDQFESLFEETVDDAQSVVAPEGYETLDDRIEQRADELEEAAAPDHRDDYEAGDEYENLDKEYGVYEINDADGTDRTGQQGRTY